MHMLLLKLNLNKWVTTRPRNGKIVVPRLDYFLVFVLEYKILGIDLGLQTISHLQLHSFFVILVLVLDIDTYMKFIT